MKRNQNAIAVAYLGAGPDGVVVTNVSSGIDGITAHPETFVKPAPEIPTVKLSLNDYVDSIAKAVTGGPVMTAFRNMKRAELAALVRPLSSYVTTTCKGNMALLLSSGLPVQSQNNPPVGPLPAPFPPALTRTASGVLAAATSPVRGASTYNWELALASAPDVAVQTAQTTAASTAFTGLTPGLIYVVRLNAFGAAGVSDWSDDIALMAV